MDIIYTIRYLLMNINKKIITSFENRSNSGLHLLIIRIIILHKQIESHFFYNFDRISKTCFGQEAKTFVLKNEMWLLALPQSCSIFEEPREHPVNLYWEKLLSQPIQTKVREKELHKEQESVCECTTYTFFDDDRAFLVFFSRERDGSA